MDEVKKNRDKKLRFCICTDSFVPRWDGISRFLLDLIPFLHDKYDVCVIAPNFSGGNADDFDFSKYGVDIVKIPVRKKSVDGYHLPRFEFFRILKEVNKADVVFVQTIGPVGIASVFASLLSDVPRINYVHSVDWDLFSKAVGGSKIKKRFIRGITKVVVFVLYNFMNVILVPSEEVALLLSKAWVKKPKMIVPLGTRTDVFVPPKNKYKAKQNVDVDPDSFVIGYCGRLSREKNLMVLYRAFKRLRKKYPGKVKFLAIGSGIAKFENLFKADNDVYYVGRSNDMVKYYQAMDVFVMPSLLETTGLVVLEAMSSGVPVISTAVGFAGKFFEEGKNGFLFNFHDEFELYVKLDNLFKGGELYRESIGREGRKTVLENANWRFTVRDLFTVVDSFKGD